MQRLDQLKNLDWKTLLFAVLLLGLYTNQHDVLLIRFTEKVYAQAEFLPQIITKFSYLIAWSIALLILNYLPIRQNRLRGKFSWVHLDESRRLRVVVMVVVGVLGWSFSFYEYNFFYNEPHYIERIALIVLMIAVWCSPIFVAPFTVLCYVISAQMSHPALISYSYTDKLLLFNFLVIVAMYVYLSPFGLSNRSALIFVTLCLVGSFYFFPGMKKLLIATDHVFWLVDNDLHNLFMSSYLNGWLSFLPYDTAQGITNLLKNFRVVLQAMTLVIELSGIVIIILGRRTAMFILVGAVCLHLGIFASSGIFFWKWIALDLVLVWYLWRSHSDTTVTKIFNPIYGIIAMLIIASGDTLFEAGDLGWYDGPINNYFEFEVIDSEGDVYEFSRSYLQPYDFRLTQSRLNFLVDDKLLANTYGTLHDYDAYYLLRSGGADAIANVKKDHGRNQYSNSRIQQFTDFIERYFSAYNQRLGQPFIFSILRPPLHIYTIPRPTTFNNAHPIVTVRVRFYEVYYDGTSVITLQDKVVLEVNIPHCC